MANQSQDVENLESLSLGDLSKLLEAQSRELDTLAEQAQARAKEREELLQRQKMLSEALEHCQQKLGLLAECKAPALAKAQDMASRLQAELNRVEQLLNPETPTDGQEEESGKETKIEESVTDSQTVEAPPPSPVPAAPPEMQVLFPCPQDVLPRACDNTEWVMYCVLHKAKQLSDMRQFFSASELRCETHLLANLIRWLQATRQKDFKTDSPCDASARKSFSILAALAKDIHAIGMVPALNSRNERDWLPLISAELDRRALLAQEHEQRQAQARRTAEQKALRERIIPRLLAELDVLLAEEETDASDLHETVMELIEYGAASDPRLIERIAPYQATFTGAQFRPLRRALQKLKEAPKGKDKGATKAPSKKAHGSRKAPVTKQLKGKTVLIIGGTPRPERQQAMQAAWKAQQVDWVTPEQAASKGNIWAKRYEVIFALVRFCSHEVYSEYKDSCKDTATPFISVTHGYGLSTLSRSFEEAVS